MPRRLDNRGSTTAAPRWAGDWENLSLVATDLAGQRAMHYPLHVQRGTLSAEEAAAGIRIAQAIALDWRRLVDWAARPSERRREPMSMPAEAPHATPAERVATLASAATRARQLADKEPQDMYRPDYAELVETLLWHERGRFGPRWLLETNIHLRATLASHHRRAA